MPASSQTSSARQSNSSNAGSTTNSKKDSGKSTSDRSRDTTANFTPGSIRTASPKPIDPKAKVQDPPERRVKPKNPATTSRR
ncbi:hypothetical protein BELL_0240g00020 [Botrytis elliptica]|uniref:Uncharacterized protein n=1 Tax=Botrytis elliptica TaxID=278938 RepID=A0A4Z1JMN7_9HELO|nr:hypothetical protein BELL_0240g00020 [Botrytis elliptica]